jgi:hypothetical protein
LGLRHWRAGGNIRLEMRPRAVIATALVAAFLAALALASFPRWHEQLHPQRAQHECAAVMFASGNCEHSAAAPSAPEISDAPISPVLLPPASALISAILRSCILEHAPPRAH